MKTSLIVYGRAYQKKCPFASICYVAEYKNRRMRMQCFGNPREYIRDKRALVVLYNEWYRAHRSYI